MLSSLYHGRIGQPALIRTANVGTKREYVLRVRPGFLSQGHLDGYVFKDEQHAREWMAQPNLSEDYYLVTAVVVRSRCCGDVVALRDEQPVEVERTTTPVAEEPTR